MGKDIPSYQSRSRRLKPSLQQWLYHARQPLWMLTAGSMIALAINFAVGQIHLSSSSDTPTTNLPSLSNQDTPNTLAGFDIKTNPETKEVHLILHRDATSDKKTSSLNVRPSKKGNQYTLTIENTQLSQQLVDSGLPVVIDNHNKLIGRAVPGKTVNQTKIIIPNLPSQEDYQVLVFEQQGSHEPKLLSGTSSDATQNTTKIVQQTINTSTETSSPPKLYSIASTNKPAASPIKNSYPLNSEVLQPRLQKAAVTSKKPQPRSAVPQIESRFDTLTGNQTIASTANVNYADKPLSRPPLESYALASVARTSTPESKIAANKKSIQIVESTTLDKPNPENTIPNLQPLTPSLNVIPNTQGSITYVPAFSSKRSTRSSLAHGPLWNPYVVKTPVEEESNQAPSSGTGVTLSSVPPLQAASIADNTQTHTPSPDPLWYLHNLSTPPATADVPLQPLPDLSQGVPTATSTLGLTSPATQTVTDTNPVAQDKQMIRSLKDVFQAIPMWVYVVFGLFFGGIGLFSLFASLYLLQQLWINIRRPFIERHSIPVTTEGMAVTSPSVTTPTFTEEPESIQFKDSTNIQIRQYLEQGRARDQQQAIKQAVKQSVLLQFPSHRVSSRSKQSRTTPTQSAK